MSIGLVGRKCGMTRIFTEDGDSIPVSVVEVTPNRVTQIKTSADAGYNAIQITTGEAKVSRVNKPLKGHYAKAGVVPGRGLWEFRIDNLDFDQIKQAHDLDLQLGAEITVNLFKDAKKVDVAGISKGKGFAGVVKRHNFSCQRATHGNSLAHRAPGSIGQNQTPGRVFKGKKMAGHMGNVRVTVQNLDLVRVDEQKNLLLIKGGIPGAPGGYVIVTGVN